MVDTKECPKCHGKGRVLIYDPATEFDEKWLFAFFGALGGFMLCVLVVF